MRKSLRHIAVFVLILSYTFVSFTGHLIVLGGLINPGVKWQTVAPEGTSKPINSRPVWTQGKHYIVATRSLELAPAVFAPPPSVPTPEISASLRYSSITLFDPTPLPPRPGRSPPFV